VGPVRPTSWDRALPSFGPRGEGWIGIQVSIELTILVVSALTGGAWGGSLGAVTVFIGLTLVALGVLGFGWGASHLGRSFSIWVAPRRGATFVASGPYRFVRHPICTAQVVLCAGWALAAASLIGLALLPVLAWYLDRFKLAREEQTLLAAYPEAYAAFMARVPHRMLPVLPGASRRGRLAA
jgi:protein-S-isoprenylcysteine O-methyltransferase Ste14